MACSIGSHPAGFIMPDTIKVMQEKGIDISSQSSKGLPAVDLKSMDWIVVLDSSLADFIKPPSPRTELLYCFLPDPVGQHLEFHRKIRDEIEMKVLDLLERIRQNRVVDSQTSCENWLNNCSRKGTSPLKTNPRRRWVRSLPARGMRTGKLDR